MSSFRMKTFRQKPNKSLDILLFGILGWGVVQKSDQ